MSMPTAGQPAPDFELQSEGDKTIKLSDYRGKRVVLFFYPRAETPGCTTEACSFRDEYAAFREKDVAILGISPDNVRAQAKFSQKHSFPFPLLADVEHKVAEAYGVWGLKKFRGREYYGVLRTTFVIDEEGRIGHVFERVKPAEHSQEVLAVL